MQIMKWLLVILLLIVSIAGCSSGGGGGGGGGYCPLTGDSEQTVSGWNRIHSESCGIYHLVNLTRQTAGASGPALTMDYMVHEPPGAATALIVLIAGGQMTAGIVGVEGSAPSSAGGNFLVRSAHLFAAQGYRVLTVDQPSDANDYTGGSASGSAYDNYRVSMEHAVDLSELINIVNTTNLPVVIAGTSRGTISAVAQHKLGAMLALSAPLTSGAGFPIGSNAVVMPANVTEPVHVSWHELDACTVTTPADALTLVSDLPDATGISINGGFASVASASPCNADHYHGFPGVETYAVNQTTDWVATKVATLPSTRPLASGVSDSTTMNAGKDIVLTNAATASAMGALTYSLPHATSSLGGTISILGDTVSYAPPVGISGLVDTFVYVVNEAGGGTNHNVVTVTINP